MSKVLKTFAGLTNGSKLTITNPLTNNRDIDCRVIGMYIEGVKGSESVVIKAQSVNSPKIYKETFALVEDHDINTDADKDQAQKDFEAYCDNCDQEEAIEEYLEENGGEYNDR